MHKKAAAMPDGTSSSGRPNPMDRISPLWIFGLACGAVIVLTVLTVLAADVDLGGLNIWIALGIAGIQCALVGAFFMHLGGDRPFYSVILMVSLFLIACFVGLSILGSESDQADIIPGPARAVRK